MYCKNCGAPAGFDILRQTYACASCGETTGIKEIKEEVVQWKTLQKQNRVANSVLSLEEYSCPACCAYIIFEKSEVSETCDFCGSKLVRKELLQKGQMPEVEKVMQSSGVSIQTETGNSIRAS